MHYVSFLKYFTSLITDPHLRMTNFLFLGVIILSYLFYKFLRRFLFVKFHQTYDTYDDTFESSLSPAIVIAAGPGELWESEMIYNRFNNVSNLSTPSPKYLEKGDKTTDSIEKNRTSKPNPVTNKSHFKTSYQKNYDEEERDLRKKEELYIAALNRGRPDGYPKILKLPNVGYLPTIFEKLPYPVTTEVLRSVTEEESVGSLKTANVPKEELVHNQSGSKIDEKRLGRLRTAENILVEKQVCTQLTTNEVGKKAISMHTTSKAHQKLIGTQLPDNTAKKETACLQIAKNGEGEEATSRILKKKKKFRKLRKFFGRFSCIPRGKD